MKRLFIFFVLVSSCSLYPQKNITLDEIWGGEFRTEYLNSFRPMQGDCYSLLEYDFKNKTSEVVKYSYKNQQKITSLVSSSELKVPYIVDYAFSQDENALLIGVNRKPIYRHSFLATYYVYDILTRTHTLIDKDIQEPTFSPNGKKVAYVKQNNLYVFDLLSKKTQQITFDGKKNKIINGIADWVYEEEFSFVRAFQWSNDSQSIAFLRFDEAKVPEFSMDVYGSELYPTQQRFKYPKAGEKNSDVTFHMYQLQSKETTKVDLGSYEYIPRIKPTGKSDEFSVITMNRHQNNLRLFFVSGSTLQSKLILNKSSNTYIDVNDDLTFLKDNSFIWLSEQSGFNHLYHYSPEGKLIRQITKGNWDVTKFYGFQPKKKLLFYQSTEQGSINRTIYSIKLNGKGKKQLTKNIGTNNASFSEDKKYFINTFSSSEAAPVYTLLTSKGKELKELKNNQKLQQKLEKYQLPKKEFSTINVGGNSLNMWMIKPTDFNPNKKYPLLMYQYSGPGSQSVKNSWNGSNDYWYYMLAQQGYIVACVDGRGTGFKGADFKKVTYKELGKYEVEDQIQAAKKLRELPYVDNKRIGIWGWSYGGFMSINCILKGNDVFSMAISVAPVTSWRFYDSIYTERYMQTPQENASGYDDNSPINHVEKLKGKLLLVHGTADDNVHVQNVMRIVEAFVQADKEIDWMIYPDKNHGIYGGNTRLHLYKKMTKFVKENL